MILTFSSNIEASDTERRMISGKIAPYGEVGNTSAGAVVFQEGSISIPDVEKIKLLMSHDNTKTTNEIWVESVVNKIQIGNLAGNRNLEFGVRNITEEFLQEKNFDLNPDSNQKLSIEIIYLDVLKTKSNVSVFHKDKESVVIRLKGVLKIYGEKVKEVIVEEESSEISMSTLIVDGGGNFNQQSLSNALKKASDNLVTKLFETN